MLYVPDSMNYYEPYFWPLEEDLPLAALVYDVAMQYRPGLQVSVGMGDAGPYFAACQALLRMGEDSLSYAYDCWGEGAKDPLVNQLLAHNRELYAGFSYVENRPAEEDSLFHYDAGSVEFLMLGPDLNSPHHAWLERLSSRGVALLAGTQEVPDRMRGYVLALGESVVLGFGEEVASAPGTLLAALVEDGPRKVADLYQHIGGHLHMHKEIAGGLFSNTLRRE